jgi:hypothetical protein
MLRRGQAGLHKGIKMRWLGYLWTVAVNCFYLFVVLYVFDKLEGKPQVVTVAVLGLIYVTMRTIAIGQFLFHLQNYIQINKSILYLRSLVNDPTYDESRHAWGESEAKTPHMTYKLYIDAAFLWVIGIFCALVLFSHL